jgi:hypothetical protein
MYKKGKKNSADLHPFCEVKRGFVCRPLKNCSFVANYLDLDAVQPFFYEVIILKKYLQPPACTIDILRFLWPALIAPID